MCHPSTYDLDKFITDNQFNPLHFDILDDDFLELMQENDKFEQWLLKEKLISNSDFSEVLDQQNDKSKDEDDSWILLMDDDVDDDYGEDLVYYDDHYSGADPFPGSC